jgi:spore germination protein YaaH
MRRGVLTARSRLARRIALSVVAGIAPASHHDRSNPRTTAILEQGHERAPCVAARSRLPVDVWGFTAPWDDRSAASVHCHARALGAVISGWLRLDSLTSLPSAVYPDTLRLPAGTRRFALVTTYHGSRFHPETVARLGQDEAARGRVAGALARSASQHGYGGLVLDFEGLTRDDTTALELVVQSIADSAHQHHIRPVTIAVVPTDTLVFASRHLAAADLLVLMLYDEHWATGVPGPIASPAWVRQGLALRVADVGAARLVAALPAYGYIWRAPVPAHPPAPAGVLSFADAKRDAARMGFTLARDSASSTLHFGRPDSAQAWVVDARLTGSLVATAESLGVRRFALWRLGLEDPGIWEVLR